MGCRAETNPARCSKEKSFRRPDHCRRQDTARLSSLCEQRAPIWSLSANGRRPTGRIFAHRSKTHAQPSVRMPRRSLGAGAIDIAPDHAVYSSPPFDFDYTPCWSCIVAGLGPEDERPDESFGFSHAAVRFDKRGELRFRDCNVANAE